MFKRKSAFFIIASLLIVVGVVFFLSKNKYSVSPVSNKKNVSWTFDGKRWQANVAPPACPEPLLFQSPVDVNLASGILYPGQIRDDFKPHGGFRFDSHPTNNVEVRAIMDGYVLKAARYEDSGEIQYFIFYINDCGIMVMHDHLLEVTSKLQKMFEKLPLNKQGNSTTTFIEPKIYIKEGELLATEIGYEDFEGRKNIFVDFGLYDLRQPNGIKPVGEYAPYALCWFDYLESGDAKKARSLPAGGKEGKFSDYCN